MEEGNFPECSSAVAKEPFSSKSFRMGLGRNPSLLGAAVFLHRESPSAQEDAGVKKNGKLFTEMKKFLISEFVFHKFQVPFFNS